MTEFGKAAELGVAIAVTVLVLGTILTTAGNYIEQVDSTSEWDNAILEADSSNYNVENDTVFIENDGTVVTDTVNISDKENVSFETSQLDGNSTVTVYDGSDSQVITSDLDGEDSFSGDIPDSVDEYYVEYTTGTSETSDVDSYETKEPSGDMVQYLQILIIGFIGIGILAMYGSLS